ncbi:MAG: hypothetical protein SPF96_05500, partial [Prevotella sp.]|nr:hypothetical protein [Prevotella sp.]
MASFRCPAVEFITTYSFAVALWLTRSFSHGVMLSLISVSWYCPLPAFLSTRMPNFIILPAT